MMIALSMLSLLAIVLISPLLVLFILPFIEAVCSAPFGLFMVFCFIMWSIKK